MTDKMICDMETGICGPVGENTPTTGFIDLSAPLKQVEVVSEELENQEISSSHTAIDKEI